MTDPKEIARGIAEGYTPCMSKENVNHLGKVIAAALLEYGGACVKEEVDDQVATIINEAIEQADVEGYRRGLEEAVSITKQAMKDQDEYGLADGKYILKELQRGIGGGE